MQVGENKTQLWASPYIDNFDDVNVVIMIMKLRGNQLAMLRRLAKAPETKHVLQWDPSWTRSLRALEARGLASRLETPDGTEASITQKGLDYISLTDLVKEFIEVV